MNIHVPVTALNNIEEDEMRILIWRVPKLHSFLSRITNQAQWQPSMDQPRPPMRSRTRRLLRPQVSLAVNAYSTVPSHDHFTHSAVISLLSTFSDNGDHTFW